MAIRSTFYDTKPGEGVTEVPWAQSALSRGATYGVVGGAALKLTAHPTTPYAVNIGPGKFFGHGVWDDNESTTLVQCATPTAGATRWDLIAARRDWQPAGGGPTSLRAISGSAAQAIPAGRENRPGVVDDQPLWLVQWKAGLPQPQQIIDLRAWAGPGGVEAAHALALSYLAEPGAAVKVGSVLHRYELQANNVWGWVEYPYWVDDAGVHRNIGNGGTSYGEGWGPFDGGGYSRLAYRKVGQQVHIYGAARVRSTVGPASVVAVMPPGLRPLKKTPGIRCEMNPDGALRAEGPWPAGGTPSFFVSYFVA